MSHEAWLELADLHAAGALGGEGLLRLEAHLGAGCAECERRLAETRAALGAAPVPVGRGRGTGRWLWWAGWAGLAAAAALLVFVNAQLSWTRDEMQALRARIEGLQGQLADRETTVRLLSDPGSRPVALSGLAPSPGASAWLLWNATARTGLLLARDLPPAPAGKAYELWAIAGSTPPVPAGVFSVDAAGRGMLRLAALPGDHRFDTFAVSLEPAGGAPAPTGPIHLAGKL